MKDRRIPDPREHEMPFQHVQPMPGMPCMPGQPCIPQETVIRNVKLANAYVPFQNMCNLFSPIEGLKKGTIFPELYSPYTGVDKRSRPPEYE